MLDTGWREYMGKLGVIADDFTGATDIAGFLSDGNVHTIQTNGTPSNTIKDNAQAIVVSLKTRSCSKELAVKESLKALDWLKSQGCDRFYFKYCSTFDSTSEGNIGPVIDALLEALGENITVVCPSLPVNGRTVYKGYLFVNDELLSESGMKNHPITPMLDSKISRLMKEQSEGRTCEIFIEEVEKGSEHIKDLLESAEKKGYNYAVIDAITQTHLDTIASGVKDLRLVTGGSGLAIGLAKLIAEKDDNKDDLYWDFQPRKEKTVIISGSCSVKTNKQVDLYKDIAPSFSIDLDAYLLDSKAYVEEVSTLLCLHANGGLAPLIYATRPPSIVAQMKRDYPTIDIGLEIERFFGLLAKGLYEKGIRNFICAGGETSGVIAQSLGIEVFKIGPQIDPAVPWVKAIDDDLFLALKSGNFGSDDFFRKAQSFFN